MLLLDTLDISSVIYYYVPLGLNSLSLFLSFLMLLTFMKFKRLRMNSGNLILSILLLEFLFSAFLFSNFFYILDIDIQIFNQKGYEMYPQITTYYIIKNDDLVCQILGGSFIFLIFSLLSLNLCLPHNLYSCVRYKTVQNPKYRFMKYVIFSIIVSFAVCLATFLNKDIGSGELGYCGIKDNSELEILIFLFLFMIFSFNLYVGVYVIKNKESLIKSINMEQEKLILKSKEQNQEKTNKPKNQQLSTFGVENLRNSQKGKNLDENNSRNSQKGKNLDENNSSSQVEIKQEDSNLSDETARNMRFAISNLEVFIKINLHYILVFMVSWLPMEILSLWSFWCVFDKHCEISTAEDVLRLMGLYVMCSNALLLFLVRIKENKVKKKLTKLFFVRSKKGKKKTDNDIKSKLIKHAIKNEKREEVLSKKPSINNTELTRFDSNSSFQMMMRSSPKETSNQNFEIQMDFHPDTRAATLHTFSSKDYSSSSEEKAESMNDMMKIFLVLPFLLEKLDNLLPESQYSEVLITNLELQHTEHLPLESKGSLQYPVKMPKSKQNTLNKAFSLKEVSSSKKDINKEDVNKDSSQIIKKEAKKESFKEFDKVSKKGSLKETESKKNSLNDQKDEINKNLFKKSKFKQPPWTDYLYNKYYLEEIEISNLMKDSLEIMSKFKISKEKITCVAYNKEYFDWMYEFSDLDREDLLKAFNFIENLETLKKIEALKTDLEIKTSNSRFFLKIIGKDVKKFLVEKYFKSYHLYVHQQKNSFLPKILGLFSFQFHSNNTNISFILYENPFVRGQKLQEKTDILGYLRINPLKVKKRIVFNEEKIAEHYHRSYSFTVKEDDLKLKKEEKNRMLGILKNDLVFLSTLQAYKYSFVMFFYKFNDKFILKSLDSDVKEEIYIGNKRNISKLNLDKNSHSDEGDFGLKNGIGYCIATFYEVFHFLKNHNKKKMKGLEKSGEISQSIFSAENSELYGQSLLDLVQEI